MSNSGQPAEIPPVLLPALLHLSQAADNETLWAAFQRLLRLALPLDRVTLYLGHIEMGEARVVYTDPPIENAAAWFAQRGRNNPFSAYIESHRRTPWYRFSDIVGPPEVFRQTEFYREFASTEGWDKGWSGIYWQKDDVAAMYSLYRGGTRADFSDSETGLLSALQPWLHAAIERVARFRAQNGWLAALEDFNRDMPLGLLLLDWQWRPLFVNQRGYEQCAAWNFGEQEARQFKPRECFSLPEEITQAVESLRQRIRHTEPKELARHAPEPIVCVSRREARQRARISATLQGSPARPGFFILFFEPDPGAAVTPEEKKDRRLRDLRQLTPAERELARLVCQGLGNAALAERLHKSVLTVKTQLNAIYRKLEVRSRAELMARWQ